MAEETATNRQFRNNMRQIRDEKGWSQGELSRRLLEAGWGVFHQTTITRIENGTRQVRLDEAIAIANALGVTLETMTVDAGAAVVLAEVRKSSEIRRELSALGLRYAEAQRSLEQELDRFRYNLGPDDLALVAEILDETAGDAALIAVRDLMQDLGVDDYRTFVKKLARRRRRNPSLAGVGQPRFGIRSIEVNEPSPSPTPRGLRED